jgi:hypothetical protein
MGKKNRRNKIIRTVIGIIPLMISPIIGIVDHAMTSGPSVKIEIQQSRGPQQIPPQTPTPEKNLPSHSREEKEDHSGDDNSK